MVAPCWAVAALNAQVPIRDVVRALRNPRFRSAALARSLQAGFRFYEGSFQPQDQPSPETRSFGRCRLSLDGNAPLAAPMMQ
jgi:hypothetical protein